MANPLKKAWKRVQKEGEGAQKKLTKAGKEVTKPVTKLVKGVTRLTDIEKLTEVLRKNPGVTKKKKGGKKRG